MEAHIGMTFVQSGVILGQLGLEKFVCLIGGFSANDF